MCFYPLYKLRYKYMESAALKDFPLLLSPGLVVCHRHWSRRIAGPSKQWSGLWNIFCWCEDVYIFRSLEAAILNISSLVLRLYTVFPPIYNSVAYSWTTWIVIDFGMCVISFLKAEIKGFISWLYVNFSNFQFLWPPYWITGWWWTCPLLCRPQAYLGKVTKGFPLTLSVPK